MDTATASAWEQLQEKERKTRGGSKYCIIHCGIVHMELVIVGRHIGMTVKKSHDRKLVGKDER